MNEGANKKQSPPLICLRLVVVVLMPGLIKAVLRTMIDFPSLQSKDLI